MKGFFITIDQGTTSTRAILYDNKINKVDFTQVELTQYYPEEGWVEHDLEEIWLSVVSCVSNLIRNNFLGSAVPLGTGMSVSSGIFTFPRTGKYLVTCQASFNIDGSDNVIVFTVATTDNFTSQKNVAIAMDANNGSGARTASSTSLFLLDVTDTSQVKVKFNVSSISGNSGIRGCSNPSADAMETNFCFIRLGDT